MPLYSPGRRRAIVLLLLSSILIITLDMRGNSLLNTARSAWTEVLNPFESAAEVVSRPIRNAWRGITRYDDLEARNRQLEEQIEAQRSNNVQARAIIDKYQELLASENLEQASDYPLVIAPVVGPSPSNADQLIEINRGRADGIRVGMPVLSTGGGFLIGRIARVSESRATVRLLTDETFFAEVKIIRPETELPEVQFNVITTTTTTTTTTLPPGASLPDGSQPATPDGVTTQPPTTPPATPVPVDLSGVPPLTTTTSTTLPTPAQRETGTLHGLGAGQPLEVTLIDNNPTLGVPEPGDVVMTAGGSLSLAPADVMIGLVTDVINTSPAEGLRLLVVPFANLDSFEHVQVMLYQPESEAADD